MVTAIKGNIQNIKKLGGGENGVFSEGLGSGVRLSRRESVLSLTG